LADINPNSEEVYPKALMDIGFHEVKSKAPWPAHSGGEDAGKQEASGPGSVRFQGMRVGYFCEDKESTLDRVVLNRIVTLKADPGKAS
jgi:glutaminyl-tRNA synthetase